MSTQIQLEVFEGPLDLLLHLIKKNEVSIADIPIATITEQYLATLELMQSLNLDVAGEFLVMAATLIHIKSRILLPPEEDDGEDDEEADTREELIRKLMEYQRFKEAAERLESREILRRDVFARPSSAPEEVGSVEFERVSLFDLLTALKDALSRWPEKEVHEVTVEKVSVREKMSQLLDGLHRRGKETFQSLLERAVSRLDAIVTFLAMLELVRLRAIRIFQGERFGPIILELSAPLEHIQARMGQEKIGGDGDGA